MTPPVVAMLGLGAIIGAVTSSFSASILSAGAMFTWNCCHRLLRPRPRAQYDEALMREFHRVLGAGAVVMAFEVRSVQALWFFTSDLVFVLLFPQLVCALFDRQGESHWVDGGLLRLAGFCGWAAASRSSTSPADPLSRTAFRLRSVGCEGLVRCLHGCDVVSL